MERMNMNEYHGNRKHANTSSSAIGLGSGSGSGSGSGLMRSSPSPIIREQDQYMPIANVIRIMRRILPSHAKISDDAKETIQECVSEYISFVTGEANDRCQREQRKTVTAEDVMWAMSKLGFDDYVPPLTLFLNRYRAANNNTGNNNVVPDQGSGASVGHDHFRRGIVDVPYPVGPGYGPTGPGHVVFGSIGGHYGHGMFDPMVGGPPGGYFPTGGPPSSSGQNNGSLGDYDPFSQFK